HRRLRPARAGVVRAARHRPGGVACGPDSRAARPSRRRSLVYHGAMKKRVLVALTVVAVARPFQGRVIVGPERPAPPDHAECAHLVMLKFPDVKVTEAAAVPAAQGATSGAIRVPHCKVSGVIGAEIKF